MSGGASSRSLWPLLTRRVGSAVLTLMLVSLVIFGAASLLPGDAAQEALGQSATPEQVAALRHDMGLDAPAPLRYAQWLSSMLRGDAGQSLVAGMPVVDIIPEFLVATMGVLIFSVKLMWLPSIAMVSAEATWGETLRSCALPVFSLTVVVVAQMARMTRAAIADQLDRPYVEMARLKGASLSRVVLRHVLPNCLGPIVNAMALSLSYLMGGAIIVETIFNFPGLASLMVNAVTSRDMPLLQACAMIFCSAYLLLMLVADTVALLANPRLRAQ
jgi:peptide/nickel transport system permease protein